MELPAQCPQANATDITLTGLYHASSQELLENTPFSPEQLLDGMNTLALVCRWVPN